MGRVVSLGEE
jgi:hypothetical protein